MRIHSKIVAPFTLLFVLVIVVTALISVRLVSRNLDRRFQDQVEHVSELLSGSDFALNRSILEMLKPITDAEIVTCARDGEIIAATLSPESDGALLDLIRSTDVIEALFSGEEHVLVRDIRHLDRPYKVAYRRLRSPRNTFVAFAKETADIQQVTSAIAGNIGVVAVIMIVLMAVLSQLIARSITSPLGRLVHHTRELAAGRLHRPVEISSRDEVQKLATAFNDMAEQLQESERKLVEVEKLALAGQLAARVAHDIRNPLSSMKMQAQLLREQVSADGGKESVQAILQEIDRVERVVQGLLDLARPAELELRSGDVNQVLEAALALTADHLRHRKIVVERELDPTLQPRMLDPDRLHQALLNVIINAAEAMPDGGRLVASTGIDEDGSSARIEITDEGVGIDPGDRDRLFDPFFTTKREGVGLGLVNAKSIVDRHGGRIRLLPRREGGTRVLISLPGVIDTEDDAEIES